MIEPSGKKRNVRDENVMDIYSKLAQGKYTKTLLCDFNSSLELCRFTIE